MTTPKKYYSLDQVQGFVLEIARRMQHDQWKPDYIVGITRGGLVPATLLSHYLNVRLETLNVSLRDKFGDMGPETNCWMAEDAFAKKNILIVDDINDSGATFAWIKNDWQGSCYTNSDDWKYVWCNNVRFAVLIDNEVSESTVNYSGLDINKSASPEWCVFPWEEWWRSRIN